MEADLRISEAGCKKGDLSKAKRINKGKHYLHQPFVKSGSCRGSVGKRRRPCPINRHASTEAAGFWGRGAPYLTLGSAAKPSPSAPWARGLLSGFWEWGCPDLPAYGPRSWPHQRPGTAHLQQQQLKTLARGQASRGGRHQDLLRGGLPRLAPKKRRYLCKGRLARCT